MLDRNLRAGERARRWKLVGMVFVSLLLVYSLLEFAYLAKEPYWKDLRAMGVTIDTDPSVKIPRKIELSEFSHKTDEEWIPVLKHGRVHHIEVASRSLPGLADKWIVHFTNGMRASAKPMEVDAWVSKEWDLLNMTESLYRTVRPHRADRKMQGWNEVVAFYADRVMGLYRKPPIVGRAFSSDLLHGKESAVFANLPAHPVYLSLHGWVSRMRITPPRTEIKDFLTMQTDDLNEKQWEFAMRTSDTLVFDFLLDDHDRNLDHNWVSGPDLQLMIWDSGLAFNHGPWGRSSCLSLLCGPDAWWKTSGSRSSCTRICRFRRTFIETLRGMSASAPEEERLGARLERAVREDLLFPVVNFGVFYDGRRYPKYQFNAHQFYEGMDRKLAKLLKHVDSCVSKHGADRVLLDE